MLDDQAWWGGGRLTWRKSPSVLSGFRRLPARYRIKSCDETRLHISTREAGFGVRVPEARVVNVEEEGMF